MKKARARSRHKKIEKLRHDPICYLCGEEIESIEDASWDHITPLSKGGADSAENLALTHSWCNSEKGDLSPFMYRIFRFLNGALFKIRPGRPSKRLASRDENSRDLDD